MTKTIVYNRVNPNGLRWVENPAAGLRFEGFADELAPHTVNHTGWFCDDFEDSTARGVVYALPARDGARRLVPGIADPWGNDAALLDFDWIHDTERDAALAADELARIFAEKEREYQAASSAGFRVSEIAEELTDLRHTTMALIAERREAARGFDAGRYLTICRALHDHVTRNLKTIRDLRKERDDLISDFGHCDGFADC